MTAAEWHEYLVRLAVEAGADRDRASERMAQAAQTFALLAPETHESASIAPGGAADVVAAARELRIAEQELRARWVLGGHPRERKRADRRVARARRELDAVLGARVPWSVHVERGLARWAGDESDAFSAAYARCTDVVPGAEVFPTWRE